MISPTDGTGAERATEGKRYREAEMSPAVSAWIASQGFIVYTEVPCYSRPVDFVGVDWATSRIIIVETKVHLSHHVVYQTMLAQNITKLAYAAVSVRPRSLEKAKTYGIGVLLISGDRVEILLEPTRERPPSSDYTKNILDKCRVRTPGGIGGMPTVLGDGPAQRVFDAIQKYRAENPKAKWKDIYASIPNHYSGYRSMQGAMRIVEMVRAQRARRKA